jgi:hypothetical protein
MHQPGDLQGARAHELRPVYNGVFGAVDAEIGLALKCSTGDRRVDGR